MFFLSSLNTASASEIQKIFYPTMNENNDLGSNYSLNEPYKLFNSTLHPDNHETYYVNFQIVPNASMYSVLTKDEANIQLNAKLHQHDFFELMFVVDGEVYQNIEYERHLYTKGCCCLLNKNVRHTEEYNSDFRIVFLQLREDFIRKIYDSLRLNLFGSNTNSSKHSDLMSFLEMNLSANPHKTKDYLDFIPSSASADLVELIHGCLDTVANQSLIKDSLSSLTIARAIEDLFMLLSDSNNFSTVPVSIGGETENTLFSRISQAMYYSNGRVTRSQLSQTLNYSGAYLNEICKKYSGLSIFDYGMTYCMKEAARLLTASNESITDISDELAFTNRNHFYKIFKEYFGCTPAQYRRKAYDLSVASKQA